MGSVSNGRVSGAASQEVQLMTGLATGYGPGTMDWADCYIPTPRCYFSQDCTGVYPGLS